MKLGENSRELLTSLRVMVGHFKGPRVKSKTPYKTRKKARKREEKKEKEKEEKKNNLCWKIWFLKDFQDS